MRSERSERFAWLLAGPAVLVLAMAAGGCSPGADGDGDHDPPGEEAALAHAECMREHGFDWPDPKFVDGEWETHYEGIDLESPEYKQAEVECQQVRQEAGPDDGDLDPAERAAVEQELAERLEFAACMREHGIDYPDPELSEDGRGISELAGPVDGDWDRFNAATKDCEEQLR